MSFRLRKLSKQVKQRYFCNEDFFQEAPSSGDIKPEKISEYRKRAQTLVKMAR